MKRVIYLGTLALVASWWWQPAAHGSFPNSLLPFEKTPPHLAANTPSSQELIRSLKLQTTNQPGDPEAWYQLGLAYAQMNQTDLAVGALQKAVTLDPVHVLAWENLGVNLYFNHQSEEAARAFKRAVDLGATDPEVWNGYGLILLDLNRLPESEDALNQGLKVSTHSRRIWNSLGLLRMKEGKNPEAMQAFQQALQVDPQYAVAWNNLGVVQAQSGTDDAGAQDSFQKATQFDPKLVQAWRSLAGLYIKKRDPVDAGNAAREVIKLQPDDVDGWLILGQSARGAEDWPTVVDSYHRAIDEIGLGDSFLEGPHDLSLAYADYGMGCANIGHYVDAEKLLNQAIAIDPSSAEACGDLGYLQMLEGKEKEALVTTQKALDLDPNRAASWVTLGSTHLWYLNQPAQAEQAFQKAVAIQPDYSGAWSGLGSAELLLQKKDEAATAFRKALAITPNYLDAWRKLGASASDPVEVDDAFAKAIGLDPRDVKTYTMQGAALALRHDWPATEKAERQALALADGDSGNWTMLSAALFNQQRYAEAAAAEEKAIQRGANESPEEKASAWGCLGEAHIYQAHDQGGGATEWQAALDALKQAVVLNPKNSTYWYDIALCDKALGRTSEIPAAEEQFQALGGIPPRLPGINAPQPLPPASPVATGIASSSPEAVGKANVIRRLIQNKQFDEALSEAQMQTQKHPDDPVAWYDQGDVLMNMKQYEAAISCLTKSTTLEPKMGPAWFDLGNSLAYLQKFDDAIPPLTKSIGIMPDYPLNWQALAQCYNTKGDIDGGIAALQTLLQAHPESGYGWDVLGDLQGMRGNHDAAKESAMKAVKLQPNYSHAWNSLGLIYKDEGDTAKSIESLHQATATDPANAEAWNNLGYILFTAGKTNEAIDSYQHALKANPQHQLALYNLTDAYTKQGKWDLARQTCDALAMVDPAQAAHLRQRIPEPGASSAPAVTAETPAVASAPAPAPQSGVLQFGPLPTATQNPAPAPIAPPPAPVTPPVADPNFAARFNNPVFSELNITVCAGLILSIVGLIMITTVLKPRSMKSQHFRPATRPPPPMKAKGKFVD